MSHKKQKTPEPSRVKEEVEDELREYVVEEIRDERIRPGTKNTKEYWIKWEGYPISDNTWEPAASLKQCKDVMQEWLAKKAAKETRSTSEKATSDSEKTKGTHGRAKSATKTALAGNLASTEKSVEELRKKFRTRDESEHGSEREVNLDESMEILPVITSAAMNRTSPDIQSTGTAGRRNSTVSKTSTVSKSASRSEKDNGSKSGDVGRNSEVHLEDSDDEFRRSPSVLLEYLPVSARVKKSVRRMPEEVDDSDVEMVEEIPPMKPSPTSKTVPTIVKKKKPSLNQGSASRISQQPPELQKVAGLSKAVSKVSAKSAGPAQSSSALHTPRPAPRSANTFVTSKGKRCETRGTQTDVDPRDQKIPTHLAKDELEIKRLRSMAPFAVAIKGILAQEEACNPDDMLVVVVFRENDRETAAVFVKRVVRYVIPLLLIEFFEHYLELPSTSNVAVKASHNVLKA